MKTIRVTDETHRRLTGLLGERIAATKKAQTFNDVIDDLILQAAKNQKEEKSK